MGKEKSPTPEECFLYVNWEGSNFKSCFSGFSGDIRSFKKTLKAERIFVEIEIVNRNGIETISFFVKDFEIIQRWENCFVLLGIEKIEMYIIYP